MVVLDVKSSRLEPFKTRLQEICQLIERTTGSVPFQVVSVDYAGPISYKASSKRETGKAYILLFACSLTRAIHLELLSASNDRGVYQEFQAIHSKKGEAPKGVL